MCAEATYFQVHLFANALARTNSLETDLVKRSVLGSNFDAPQGRMPISAATSHTSLWARVGRVGGGDARHAGAAIKLLRDCTPHACCTDRLLPRRC